MHKITAEFLHHESVICLSRPRRYGL